VSAGEPPTLIVIAGPNGVGKSTFTATVGSGTHVPVIGPDAIARRLQPLAPEQAAMEAGREALRQQTLYLEQDTSFAVETTLAGKAVLRLMERGRERGFTVHLVYICIENVHGRLEIRRHWTIQDPESSAYLNSTGHWAGLQGVGMVEEERRVGARVSTACRYYVLSRPLAARTFGDAVRSHWGVENRVHWILDVAFRFGREPPPHRSRPGQHGHPAPHDPQPADPGAHGQSGHQGQAAQGRLGPCLPAHHPPGHLDAIALLWSAIHHRPKGRCPLAHFL